MVIGTNQMIRRGFAGGVRRVWLIGQFLMKRRILRAEGTKDFIRRDMVKTMLCYRRITQPHAVRSLKQAVGTHHVGIDKGIRAADGTVNVAFCGKMDNNIHRILLEQAVDEFLVADIPLDKDVIFRVRKKP